MCKMFLFIVLLCFVAPSVISRVAHHENFCSGHKEEFSCLDGGCVSLDRRCDAALDCKDGSDEMSCDIGEGGSFLDAGILISRRKRQASCRRDQWRCKDGSCISFDGKCDGVGDCPDNSDETHALCRSMPCQNNLFRCTYGACVDGNAACNGVVDCIDRSDELLPRCTNETLEYNGGFKCHDGSWIPASDYCDGVKNCPDGSDETVRACAGNTCPSYLFQCAYGACVDQGSDCNGKKDCADGSDEAEDLCNKILPSTNNNTTTKPPVTSGSCVLPQYPEHGTYVVGNQPDTRPGQRLDTYVLTVSCNPGYGFENGRQNDAQTIYCIQGVMYSPMPTCVRYCKLDKDPSVTYNCEVKGTTGHRICDDYVAPGTSAKPTCNRPNYYSPDVLSTMKCYTGSWNYVAQCKPECGLVTPNGAQLVLGGELAKRGELPWHTGVYEKMSDGSLEQICGGSLISNKAVLSAAHCFWKSAQKQPASNYEVALGKLHRQWDEKNDTGVQKSKVKEIKMPSLFKGPATNFQEDIAVLILVTAIRYETYVRPVCLSFELAFERQQLQPGKSGKVAGWGLISANGPPSEVLKVVSMPYIDDDTCIREIPKDFREYITGDKFCAGYTNGTALCHGDSGGGLAFPNTGQNIERYYLRGIVSTAPNDGNLCNANTYTAFTKISKHEDIIAEALSYS